MLCTRLQARAVDDLHVNSELAASVAEDEDTDAAAARLESLGEAAPQVALLRDGQAGLNITGLGHGDDVAILHVQNTVLLEDGAEHGLDDDARAGVLDLRGLLVQLLGEQVDTEVTVLASGAGGGDADDLARAALKDQDVAHADVVAGDGNGVRGALGRAAGAADGNILGVVLVSHCVRA